MICGAEDLVTVCKEMISPKAHALSADGKFSWEEVECLGACANAPMAQIGKDYYEDLTADKLRLLIAQFSIGEVPVPGPQNGRYAAEPVTGLTSLKHHAADRLPHNASVQAAIDHGDTIRRIDGTEVPNLTPWLGRKDPSPVQEAAGEPVEPTPGAGIPADATGVTVQQAPAEAIGRPEADGNAPNATPRASVGALAPDTAELQPEALAGARNGTPDDLQKIEGIGPVMERLCHGLGIFHFDQIASWGPAEIAWMDRNLEGFEGCVSRDKWVAQADIIVGQGMEGFPGRPGIKDF